MLDVLEGEVERGSIQGDIIWFLLVLHGNLVGCAQSFYRFAHMAIKLYNKQNIISQ